MEASKIITEDAPAKQNQIIPDVQQDTFDNILNLRTDTVDNFLNEELAVPISPRQTISKPQIVNYNSLQKVSAPKNKLNKKSKCVKPESESKLVSKEFSPDKSQLGKVSIKKEKLTGRHCKSKSRQIAFEIKEGKKAKKVKTERKLVHRTDIVEVCDVSCFDNWRPRSRQSSPSFGRRSKRVSSPQSFANVDLAADTADEFLGHPQKSTVKKMKDKSRILDFQSTEEGFVSQP